MKAVASFISSSVPRLLFLLLVAIFAKGEDIFVDWHVALNTTIKPVSADQPVITINDEFPGPLLNATTNDMVHVNVFNHMDSEPLLITWNGIQQRLNSWQDGVSGTNCPIQPGKNWTYVFQIKDQIGSFFYFPSINFQKAGGGFGPIRINNRAVITVPFPKPDAEYDLLIGDWYNQSFQTIRRELDLPETKPPNMILMNGKGSYLDSKAKTHESFTVTKGKTYRFRISNVGTTWSVNFRIQDHRMDVVETEGSYVNKLTVDSLDVHVGQSYSVIVTADQNVGDYYIVGSAKLVNVTSNRSLVSVGVLHYHNSTTPPNGPLPAGPDPFDINSSVTQTRLITWNLTAGAARPNPQGSFNVSNVTLSQSFILLGSMSKIDSRVIYTVNNVSYLTPSTPLKLADYALNGGSGVFELDKYPANTSLSKAVNGTFVVSGTHKGWLEIVFKNDLDNAMDSWHLDGYGFYVVGVGFGEWSPESRQMYNRYDPVVRSTVQVYPKGWTAVYVYLANPGMWNLRSQHLKKWYLGQELYIRVYDPDPNPAKEKPPPQNLLYCGQFNSQ
nr:monocopper oxidase-like protein SKS2 [Ipomoea trifida]